MVYENLSQVKQQTCPENGGVEIFVAKIKHEVVTLKDKINAEFSNLGRKASLGL